MTNDDVAVFVRRATPHDALAHLSEAALSRATGARGGGALVEQIFGVGVDAGQVVDLVDAEVAKGHVWIAQRIEEIVAGALVVDGCIKVIWVQPTSRRHQVATAILDALLASEDPPRDAWALPGDRATKSLYESIGWKARLLTMRGE